jgi:hypothetical protein
MKMFRQKSYDVLKGPPLQLLFWEAQIMVQVMLSIYENYIVDASWPHALPRTMETLDCAVLPSSGLLSAYMS